MTLTALLTEKVLLRKLAGPRTSMQPAHCNLCLDQHIPTINSSIPPDLLPGTWVTLLGKLAV